METTQHTIRNGKGITPDDIRQGTTEERFKSVAPKDDSKVARTVPVTELLTLTVAQAATLLGWRRQLIDQAIRAGQLRPLSYPGVTRISRKELERYLDSITSQ